VSVRKRQWTDKDGKVQVSWDVDVKLQLPDGGWRRIRKASPINSRRGAEQYERELRQAILAGTYGKQSKAVPTLDEFKERFLVEAETNNKRSTLKAKKDILKKHLLPLFGRARLNCIGPYEVEQYKALKLREGLNPKTINNHLTTLRKLLSLAAEWGELDQIPRVKWLKTAEPPIDFLAFEEADRLEAGADPDWRAMIVVALNTGLRLGELCGLQWDCVDLAARKLFVRRNLYRGHMGTPKSGRSREVPLNDRALSALKQHRHLKGPFVFCNASGGPFSIYNAPTVAIARACRRAGLRPLGWHALRHTFASHLVMRGVPLKAVQELLGHATIDVTMRYAHLSPDTRREAVATLDNQRRAIAPAGSIRGQSTAGSEILQ
jgi:integrase